MQGGAKKNYKIVKIEKGILTKKQETVLMKKVLSNKDSFSAAKKAANAILKNAPKKKKVVKFIIENQKPNKKGVKKQLAYTAQRDDERKKVKIDGKELEFTASPKVKSCLKTEV